MVEKAGGLHERVNLVDFGSVRFSECAAQTAGGRGIQYGLDGATVYKIVKGNNVITDVKVSGQHDLVIRYGS